MTVLSVVIVNWNTADLLRQCLTSLLQDPDNRDAQIIVVDNASSDESVEVVRTEFPSVTLIANQRNAGYACANNQGIMAAAGEYVLLLNCDTVVPVRVCQALVRFAQDHPDAGVVGPQLLCPKGEPQPYGFGEDPTLSYLVRRDLNEALFHRPLHNWATKVVREVEWVSGACMLVRRSALEQVGLLDEHTFMYFEDNDLCLRLRKAGWKVYHYPEVAIIHYGGESVKKNPDAQKAYFTSLRHFYRKHYGRFSRIALDLGLAVMGRGK